jgi:hypothetical protein
MNIIQCATCGKENFILNYRCKFCNAIIREKIATINLGEILIDLLINIEIGVKKVLFAEKKSYLSLLLFLLVFKMTVLTLFNISILDFVTVHNKFNLTALIFSFWIFYLVIISILIKYLLGKLANIKIKNALSLIVYSFIYFSFSIIILFPIELMLFGVYFFSNNPSIFDINPTKAYLVIFIEVIFFLYSFYLIFNFLVFILHSKFQSILFTFLLASLIYVGNETIKTIIGMI